MGEMQQEFILKHMETVLLFLVIMPGMFQMVLRAQGHLRNGWEQFGRLLEGLTLAPELDIISMQALFIVELK